MAEGTPTGPSAQSHHAYPYAYTHSHQHTQRYGEGHVHEEGLNRPPSIAGEKRKQHEAARPRAQSGYPNNTHTHTHSHLKTVTKNAGPTKRNIPPRRRRRPCINLTKMTRGSHRSLRSYLKSRRGRQGISARRTLIIRSRFRHGLFCRRG